MAWSVVDDVLYNCKACGVELSTDTAFHNGGICNKCKLKVKEMVDGLK